MMKRFHSFLYMFLMLLCFSAEASAQQSADISSMELSKKQRSEATKIITAGYSNWGRCAIDGKLKAAQFPIQPSLKIYMEKGKLLMISIRAPFLGEMGRLEATPDSILLVNRMKKVYTAAAVNETDLFSDRKAAVDMITQLQSLLLGRVVIIGKGELSSKNCDQAGFYSNSDGGWMIIPDNKVQPSWGSYGYLVYGSGLLKAAMLDADESRYVVSMEYTYDTKNRSNIAVSVAMNTKMYEASLQLDAPQYGAKGFARFSEFPRFTAVSPQQFMKSI